MLHIILIGLLVLAFAGAGLVNAVGLAGARDNFVRWGYPGWWGLVTGALEIVAAVAIAAPGSRDAGLVLGAVIVAAGVLTVVRHREFSHLAPLGVFGILLVLVAFMP